MKRAWILTAMGDVRGYRKWCRNPSNTVEIRRPIMKKFLNEITAFGKKHECQTKYLGDGFIFIFEIQNLKKKEKCFHKTLIALRDLTKSILKIIQSCPWPNPEGFRMRVTGGWVDIYPIGGDARCHEFIGESPNLARDLLYVSPQVGILVHSSVVKKLNQEQIKALKINKFRAEKNRRIQDSEIDELWEIPL